MLHKNKYKIKFQSCKLALDFLIFVFFEFKLSAGIYLSLMKVAVQVDNFYSIHIMLFKNAWHQFELYHKTVCKEDSSKTKTKKPETSKTLEKAH